jgi:dTDP-glucose 4,6-dehydratase
MRILVTGGAGFIGSNFIRAMGELHAESQITNLDKLTYAGNLENLEDLPSTAQSEFVRGDICDATLVGSLFAKHDAVVHFAAESHVDRSILATTEFFETNIRGTHVLLEAARQVKLWRFLHVSTDEVYGSMEPEQTASETSPLRPSSPYAASKAAAEMLVMAYAHTYHVPAIITRASNNYGPCQFPEKFIPLMITNAIESKKLPVYGDGLQVRDWLHVEDHCRALDRVLHKGKPGGVYNIGAGETRTNMDVLRTLLRLLDRPESLLEHVKDRPGHDRRYALDCTKIQDELGWKPKESFEQGIRKTVGWYKDHSEWVARVKSGSYRDYYERHYVRRNETWSGLSSDLPVGES